MASEDVGYFLQAFNPMDLIKGFEFGQQRQREEEASLARTENERLRNSLLGTTVSEFQGAPATAARASETELKGLLANLGLTTAGVNLQAAQEGRADILAGLNAQTTAARRGAELGAERAGLAQDLFKPQAQVARAEAQQNVDLLGNTLKIREQRQKVQLGQTESDLRRLDELTMQSGAIDTLRQAVAENPNAAPYDVMLNAFQRAPAEQKAIIAARMQIQDQQDLSRIGSVEEANAWLQRAGRQVKANARQEGNQLVVTPMVMDPATGQAVAGQPQRFASWEDFKRQYGAALPRGTPPERAPTKAPALSPADVLRQLAGTPGQAQASGATPQRPAAAPARAAAPAIAIPPPAAPAAQKPIEQQLAEVQQAQNLLVSKIGEAYQSGDKALLDNLQVKANQLSTLQQQLVAAQREIQRRQSAAPVAPTTPFQVAAP